MKTAMSESYKKSNIFRAINAVVTDYMIACVSAILIIVLSIASDVFLTPTNLVNVFRQISMTAILSVGTFFVLIGGGIDISLGSIVGFCGVVFASLMAKLGFDPIISFIFTLIIGSACGMINGILVAWCRIPPFVATMGMMSVARGFTYVVTNAVPVTGLPKSIEWIGRGYLWEIPWPVFFMFVVFLVAGFVEQKTKFGRFCYAAGGNEQAAYLSGINVPLVRSMTYVIGGGLAAISGVILTSRLNSGQPAGGKGWEFDALTAAVLGGVSINGGKGKALGVFFGALFVGLLTNGMSLLEVSSYVQEIIKGVVLVLAIGIDVIRDSIGSKK